ncbi:MAG TPA: amidohydrolase family protein, partial [Ktedonobacterales bacterium]
MLSAYRARLLFPVSAPPIRDGVVVVDGARVVAVGPAAVVLPAYERARLIELGNGALLPAAVNAHTHLELTGLAGRIPEGLELIEWIVALVRARGAYGPADFARAAAEGARRARAAGTAAIGEISTYGESPLPVIESGLRGIVYYELLGADPSAAPSLLARGQAQIARWRAEYGEEQVRFGLSLHSPYTVSAALFRLTAAWCAEAEVPLCIHVAESPAETEWLRTQDGPITERIYRPLGLPLDPDGPPACSPVAYLERLGVLAVRPLLAHGVQVDAGDVACLAAAGAPLAHCPRSNARLRCGRMPYALYREAGVRLALGTDSLASAPSLSIWDEVAAASALHAAAGEAIAPADLLRLATLDGARALGLAGDLGSLAAGKYAEMALLPLEALPEDERE